MRTYPKPYPPKKRKKERKRNIPQTQLKPEGKREVFHGTIGVKPSCFTAALLIDQDCGSIFKKLNKLQSDFHKRMLVLRQVHNIRASLSLIVSGGSEITFTLHTRSLHCCQRQDQSRTPGHPCHHPSPCPVHQLGRLCCENKQVV